MDNNNDPCRDCGTFNCRYPVRGKTSITLTYRTAYRRQALHNVRTASNATNGASRRSKRSKRYGHVKVHILRSIPCLQRYEVISMGRCRGASHRRRRNGNRRQMCLASGLVCQRRDNGSVVDRGGGGPRNNVRTIKNRLNGRSNQPYRGSDSRRCRRSSNGTTRRLLNNRPRVTSSSFQRTFPIVPRKRRANGVIIRYANGSATGCGPRVKYHARLNSRSNARSESRPNGVRGLCRGSFPDER